MNSRIQLQLDIGFKAPRWKLKTLLMSFDSLKAKSLSILNDKKQMDTYWDIGTINDIDQRMIRDGPTQNCIGIKMSNQH